jgi:hypothetical protein
VFVRIRALAASLPISSRISAFRIYVPDCDTTACAFPAASEAGSGANEPRVAVPLNDRIDCEGGAVTSIDALAGERRFGNDLDPTLDLDILDVSFRNARQVTPSANRPTRRFSR